MHLPDEILRAIPADVGQVVTWGQVISVSPLEVRFAGDTGDTPIPLQDADLALSTGDKVVLMRVGRQWMVTNRIAGSA